MLIVSFSIFTYNAHCMKGLHGYLVLLVFVALCATQACNNVAQVTAAVKAKEVLPGRWKIAKICADPKDTAGQPGDDNVIIEFKGDGSGSSTSPGGNSTFKWVVGDNDNWLRITDDASGQLNALSLTKMSSTSFTVKDTSAHPVQWETFQKQK